MNGVQTISAEMHGMGPINPKPNEPVFHEGWERRAFGIMMAIIGAGRHTQDILPRRYG